MAFEKLAAWWYPEWLYNITDNPYVQGFGEGWHDASKRTVQNILNTPGNIMRFPGDMAQLAGMGWSAGSAGAQYLADKLYGNETSFKQDFANRMDNPLYNAGAAYSGFIDDHLDPLKDIKALKPTYVTEKALKPTDIADSLAEGLLTGAGMGAANGLARTGVGAARAGRNLTRAQLAELTKQIPPLMRREAVGWGLWGAGGKLLERPMQHGMMSMVLPSKQELNAWGYSPEQIEMLYEGTSFPEVGAPENSDFVKSLSNVGYDRDQLSSIYYLPNEEQRAEQLRNTAPSNREMAEQWLKEYPNAVQNWKWDEPETQPQQQQPVQQPVQPQQQPQQPQPPKQQPVQQQPQINALPQSSIETKQNAAPKLPTPPNRQTYSKWNLPAQ
jgi:hypothetical protein